VSIDAEPNLENKDFKKTLKITWLADTSKAATISCACVYFDHIISKANLGKDEDFKNYIDHETRVSVGIITPVISFSTIIVKHFSYNSIKNMITESALLLSLLGLLFRITQYSVFLYLFIFCRPM
jgi:hypothetical protein